MSDANAVNAEIRAYKFTVEAIAGIGRAFKDLAGARLRQGPRMRTAGGTTVTPDMALEVLERRGGTGYRAVCKIKSSFPKYRAAVDQLVRQVRHYDGGLTGWKGGAAPGGSGRDSDHDIIIAVQAEHAPDFTAGLPAALKEKGVKIKSPFSIIKIASSKTSDNNEWLLLKRSFGAISHRKANDALERGWSICRSSLTKELNSTRFYDARPPLLYIMSVLWAYVFPNLLHAKKLRRLHMNMEVHVDVEVSRAHRLASRLAPLSNPGCVKRAWIRDAMEEFLRIGLAERVGTDKYRIRYTTQESRPAEWLARATTGGEDNADMPY